MTKIGLDDCPIRPTLSLLQRPYVTIRPLSVKVRRPLSSSGANLIGPPGGAQEPSAEHLVRQQRFGIVGNGASG